MSPPWLTAQRDHRTDAQTDLAARLTQAHETTAELAHEVADWASRDYQGACVTLLSGATPEHQTPDAHDGWDLRQLPHRAAGHIAPLALGERETLLGYAALVGLARGASRDAFAYAATRKVGGRPLIDRELSAARLSRIATQEITAELQFAYLCELQSAPAGAAQREIVQREIQRACLASVLDGAHIHGGHGFVQRKAPGRRVELAHAVIAALATPVPASHPPQHYPPARPPSLTPPRAAQRQDDHRDRCPPYVDSIRETIGCATPDLLTLMQRMRRLGAPADEQREIPDGLFDGLDMRRLNRAYLPVEFGGEETLQDGVSRRVLSEMLGYADPALAIALPGASLAHSPLLELGSTRQRDEFCQRFDSDQPIWGAFAMTEPSGGSDATHLATTTVRDSDGSRLSGEKRFIANGGRASFIVVFATTDPTRGQFAIQPFLVDRDTAGLAIDDSWPMLGLRAVRVAQLRFEDCWVPEQRLLVT